MIIILTRKSDNRRHGLCRGTWGNSFISCLPTLCACKFYTEQHVQDAIKQLKEKGTIFNPYTEMDEDISLFNITPEPDLY